MMETYDTNIIYEEITTLLEKYRGEILDLGRELFVSPELGFKEVKSNEILTSFCI